MAVTPRPAVAQPDATQEREVRAPGEAPLENILPYLEPKAVTSIDVGCIVEIVTGAFKGEKARITAVADTKKGHHGTLRAGHPNDPQHAW